MPLLKPAGLQPGDTIGFFSPSSAATAWAPHRFEHAIMSVIGGSNSNSLPLGIQAELDVDDQRLTLLESWLC